MYNIILYARKIKIRIVSDKNEIRRPGIILFYILYETYYNKFIYYIIRVRYRYPLRLYDFRSLRIYDNIIERERLSRTVVVRSTAVENPCQFASRSAGQNVTDTIG